MIGPTLRSILISVLAVFTAGAIGAAIGLSGLFAGPTVAGTYLPGDRRVSPADCVRGTTFLGYLPAGARVIVAYRSEDSTWVGIRTTATSDVGWLPLEVVTIDEGEPDISTLPVGGACPDVTLEGGGDPTPGPDPAPAPDPAPDPGPAPDPAPDTTAPVIGQPSITPGIVACDVGYTNPPTGTVQVSASDDRGVSRVEISWSGVVSGSGVMTPGSPWTFVFDPPGGHSGGTVTFHVQAFDAAGNASARPSVQVTVECLG